MAYAVVSASTSNELHDDASLGRLEADECVTSTAEASMQPRHSVLRTSASTIIVVAAVLSVCALSFSFVRSPGQKAAMADAQSFESFYSAMQIDPAHPAVMNYSATLSGVNNDHTESSRQLGIIHKILHTMSVDKQVRELREATCAIDATHAALYLERAALAITAATASCKEDEITGAHKKAACAADISAVIAAVGFVAEYLSEAVLMCSQTMTNMKARCSSGVSGIIANSARIATQASFIAGNCNGAVAYDHPTAQSVWQMSRRLDGDSQGDNTFDPTYNEKDMTMATCVLDASQATTYLANFGIFIDGATKACGKSKYPTSLPKHKHMHMAHKVSCAMNVFDILEAVFMASSFITSAVSHCAPAANQQALCASGALGLNGAVSGLTKSALNAYGSCATGLLKLLPDYQSAKKATAWNDAAGRRRKVFR